MKRPREPLKRHPRGVDISGMEQSAQTSAITEIGDRVTGLPGGRAWQEHLVRDIVDGPSGQSGLLIVQVEGLRWVNDRFGRDAGDRYLAKAAGVLRSSLRDTDVLVRLDGTRFGVIAHDCDSDGIASLRNRLGMALERNDIKVQLGASVACEGTTFVDAHTAAMDDLRATGSGRPQVA